MSGGSYNYLCYDDDLSTLSENRGRLEEMTDRLDGLPYARVAAEQTRRLLMALDLLDARIRHSKELREVWQAVEWWDSCDYSESQVRDAIRKYEDSGVVA